MLEVILCTCGKNIGSLIDLYDFIWEKIKHDFRVANMEDTTVDRMQWDPKWRIEAGALLDAIGCDRDCCRMNMLSRVKISKLR